MSQRFVFTTTVRPDWIDYNGHMRDSYFGHVFSLAVDAFQDEVGFDEAYRKATGSTIYLVEDHKIYLREVKCGAKLRVETLVLGCDDKRFHLYMQMMEGDAVASIGEFMELHVSQHPTPRAAPMPPAIRKRLEAACLPPAETAALSWRAGPLRALRPASGAAARGKP